MSKLAVQFLVTVLAVLIVLLGFHLFYRWTVSKHINAAFLTEGLVISASAKVAVTEYRSEWGEWPSSNEEAGLPEPWEFAGQALQSLMVSPGGIITLTFNERSGVSGGVIELWPDPSSSLLSRWDCVTSTYRGIERLIPTCRYVSE